MPGCVRPALHNLSRPVCYKANVIYGNCSQNQYFCGHFSDCFVDTDQIIHVEVFDIGNTCLAVSSLQENYLISPNKISNWI